MNLILIFILYAQTYCEDFCMNNNCSQLNGNFFSECIDCGPHYGCNFGLVNFDKNYDSYFNLTMISPLKTYKKNFDILT